MSRRDSAYAMAQQSPFFQSAGPEAMADLLRTGFTQLLPRSTVLFEQDEEPEFLHLLLEGSVGLQATDEKGARTIVEIFGSGEVFLAPAVILRLPYLVSAVALTEMRVLLIPAEPFRDSLDRSIDLARACNVLLARHWRLMVDQVVDLKLNAVEQRVARFLARRMTPESGAGLAALPEPRAAIAARLGTTPETLSRTLAALESQGRLRRTAVGPAVPDRDALVRP